MCFTKLQLQWVTDNPRVLHSISQICVILWARKDFWHTCVDRRIGSGAEHGRFQQGNDPDVPAGSKGVESSEPKKNLRPRLSPYHRTALVDATEVKPGMTALKIDGHTPGEASYPLHY